VWFSGEEVVLILIARQVVREDVFPELYDYHPCNVTRGEETTKGDSKCEEPDDA